MGPMPVLAPDDDAFGAALADHAAGRAAGRPGPELVLEVDDGYRTPALPPAAFFLPESSWAPEEREVLARAPATGPVLDLGAGAGRHALWLQSRGHEVTAVDASPGAVEVCRARGVADARLGDLTDPPTDRAWATVLLMCGNLGLAGGWDETRALLTRLAAICAPGAVLIADTVDPTALGDEHSLAHVARNFAAGRAPGQIRLRLHYGGRTTPWWDQLNVPVADVVPLVAGTGWTVATHLVATVDHYVVLRHWA
jgi:SAM-dependent methyltransferase